MKKRSFRDKGALFHCFILAKINNVINWRNFRIPFPSEERNRFDTFEKISMAAYIQNSLNLPGIRAENWVNKPSYELFEGKALSEADKFQRMR